MSRRLVSIAVSRFSGGLDDLPFAAPAAASLTDAAAAHGYTTVSDGTDPTAAELARTVLAALDGATGEDVLIVHVVSHGRAHGGSVQVYGSDGRANSGTSLDSWMADATGTDEHEDPWRRTDEAGTRPWTLFLVDVCGAGRAARVQWEFDIADAQRRAWVIAGCLPERQGFGARFTRATAAVLADIGRLDIHPSIRHVPLDRVAQEIRDEVDRLVAAEDGLTQTVVATRVDIASRVAWPPFFDNPHYRPTVAGLVRDDLREFATAVEDLFDAWHFMSRASGHPPNEARPIASGGTYRGRGRQLRALSAYLEGRAGRTNLHLVTGTPGVGKSALLGMLVCAAHPVLAGKTRELWWARRDDLPGVVADLAAVHAYEQDIVAVLGQAAAQLELPDAHRAWTVAEFVAAIRHRHRPPVLVVDAVDEAVDPAALSRALRDLADATRGDGTPAARLLVGARSGRHWRMTQPLLERAEAGGELTDLDDEPRDQLERDLSAYVDDLLRAHPGYRVDGRHDVRRILGAGIAERLAAPVADETQPRWGEFLVAGLFVNYLSRLPPPPGPAAAAAVVEMVPRTLPGVLELDLAAPEHPWFHPTLVTLAHSFGAGMPRRIVEACAGVFAPAEAGPASRRDITDALERGRFYLRRDVDSRGTTLYRLFHKALTEHLQRGNGTSAAAGPGPRPAHAALLRRLIATVPAGGGWAAADPYVLRHALDHAAAAGEADLLLADADFMVHADPDVVARHLHRAATPAGATMATVYRTSYWRHRQLADRPDIRHALLLFDAVRHGRADLTDRLAAAGVPGRLGQWRPVWATATTINSALRHTLVGHTAAVRHVACHRTAEDADVVVTAGADGTVRVWDADDGGLRHVLAAPGRTPVTGLSLARVDGEDVVLMAAGAEALVWRIADGTLRGVLSGHRHPLVAVAVTTLPDGTPVAVTADSVEGLRTWDLSTGTLRHVLDDRGGAGVLALAAVHGEPLILAASTVDGTIQVRDLAGGGDHGRPERGHDRTVRAIAGRRGRPLAVSAAVDGSVAAWVTDPLRPLKLEAGRSSAVAAVCLGDGPGAVAVTAHTDGNARVWSLDTDRPDFPTKPSAVLAGSTDLLQAVSGLELEDGTLLAVAGGADGTARVWDLDTGDVRHVLTGHTGGVTAIDCARLADGRGVAVTAAADGTARVWDLAGRHREVMPGSAGPVTVIEWCLLADGTAVVAGAGGDATVRLWNARSGEAIASLPGHEDTVTAVAFARLGEATIAVTVGADGTYRTWDVPSGRPRHVFRARSGRRALPLVHRRADGTGLLVVTTPALTLELFDLADGSSRGTPGRYLAPEAPFAALTLADGAEVAVAQSRDGRAQAWSLEDGGRIPVPGLTGLPLGGATWRAGGMSLAAIPAGRDLGLVLIRDGTAERHTLPRASRDAVLSCGVTTGGRPLVLLADGPGVTTWWLDTRTAERIPVPSGETVAAAAHTVVDGRDAVAIAAGNALHVAALAGDTAAQTLVLPEPVHTVTAGPDGSLLAGFGQDLCRLVRIHDRPTAEG
nr:hypothetical protein GCM10020063_011020 [Dactylosporangium thailandense]